MKSAFDQVKQEAPKGQQIKLGSLERFCYTPGRLNVKKAAPQPFRRLSKEPQGQGPISNIFLGSVSLNLPQSQDQKVNTDLKSQTEEAVFIQIIDTDHEVVTVCPLSQKCHKNFKPDLSKPPTAVIQLQSTASSYTFTEILLLLQPNTQ